MKLNEIFFALLYLSTKVKKLIIRKFFFYIFFIFTWSLLHLLKKNYLYVGHYLSLIFNSNLTDKKKKKQIRKQLLIKLRKIISQSLIENVLKQF